MGNLNFTTDQVQQRLAQGYYDDIKAAGYTGTKAQLDALLAKAGIVMKAATASAAGEAGLVPAPGAGTQAKYLRGDGTWQTTPDSVYSHPTTAGNKHIPSGGVAGQFLKWSADGTAVWSADNNTTYVAMKAATASVAGTAGLVPAPPAGAQNKFLKGDGTWAEAAGGGSGSTVNGYLDLREMTSAGVGSGTEVTISQDFLDAIRTAVDNNITTALIIDQLFSGEFYCPMSIAKLINESNFLVIVVEMIYDASLVGLSGRASIVYTLVIEPDTFKCTICVLENMGGASGGGVKMLPSGFANLLSGSHTSAAISGFVGGVTGFNEIYNNLEYNEANPNYCTYWLATPFGIYSSSVTNAQKLSNGDKLIGLGFIMPIMNSSGGRQSTTATSVAVTLTTGGVFSLNSQSIVNCAREIFVNTTAPNSGNGDNGDIWVQYTA